MSRLLQALDAREEEFKVRFVCPISHLDLVAVAPTSAQKIEAAKAYTPGILAEQAQIDFNLRIVRTCVLLEGVPLGAVADKLPDALTVLYATYVQEAIDRYDPSPETWTDREIEAFEDGVKKKAWPEILKTYDSATLRNCILHLVAERSRSETSMSSNSSTDEQV